MLLDYFLHGVFEHEKHSICYNIRPCMALQANGECRCVCSLRCRRDETNRYVLHVFRWRREIKRDWLGRVEPARLRAPVVPGNARSDGPSRLSLHRVLPTWLLLRRSSWNRNVRAWQRQVKSPTIQYEMIRCTKITCARSQLCLTHSKQNNSRCRASATRYDPLAEGSWPLTDWPKR